MRHFYACFGMDRCRDVHKHFHMQWPHAPVDKLRSTLLKRFKSLFYAFANVDNYVENVDMLQKYTLYIHCKYSRGMQEERIFPSKNSCKWGLYLS